MNEIETELLGPKASASEAEKVVPDGNGYYTSWALCE
jgi:hypothetical protein